MKILGIDPGSTLMGYGLVEATGQEVKLLRYGVITIKARLLPEKLLELSSELRNLIKQTSPALAGLETLFFSKNKKTAFEVAHARGVIMLELLHAHIPLVELTPGQVKIAVTGYGNADKQSVAKMVGKILTIERMEHDDNASDALAIAIATASHHNNQRLTH